MTTRSKCYQKQHRRTCSENCSRVKKQIAHEFFGNNGKAGLSPVSQNSPQTVPHHTKGFLKFTWCTPVLRTPHGSLVPMAYGVYIFNRALGMRKVKGPTAQEVSRLPTPSKYL